jgi:hypothetical protein
VKILDKITRVADKAALYFKYLLIGVALVEAIKFFVAKCKVYLGETGIENLKSIIENEGKNNNSITDSDSNTLSNNGQTDVSGSKV